MKTMNHDSAGVEIHFALRKIGCKEGKKCAKIALIVALHIENYSLDNSSVAYGGCQKAFIPR